MKVKLFNLLIAVFLSSAIGVSQSSSYEIATWKGFRTSAATFTFDDNCANQFSAAVPIFDKYGYKASFYPVINWSPNWSTLQTLVNNGHEIGSHSVSHGQTMPDSEISSSKNTIDQNISGQVCNTITYPNCNEPSETELAKYYIGGRICDGQVQSKTPSNYFRIGSIICGSQGACNSLDNFKTQFNTAISKNGWVVFLVHEVDNGSGYSPLASSVIESVLSYVKTNDANIWMTTFRNAILYAKERDAANISELSNSSTEITLKITDNLDNSTYKYPLSIRRTLPDGWSDVTVTQDGEEIESNVTGNYIYFEAIPDAGTIVLSSGSAVIPDPAFSFTSPTTAQSWCIDSTYTINWTITGEVSATYSLNWTTASASSSNTISVSSATASSEWSNDDGTFSWAASNILTDDGNNGESSRWGAKGESGYANEWVVLNLSSSQTVAGVQIDEFEEYGSVRGFEIQYDKDGSWVTAYTGTTIGEKFSITFTPVSTSKVRLYITAAENVNINYFFLNGVSNTNIELKSGISASGSFQWKPTTAGTGSLTINKSSGKALSTSEAISISSCSGNTSGSGGSVTLEGGFTGPSCDGSGKGAYSTGVYRNLFSEYLGKTQTEVDAKIESIWNHFFVNSTNKVYYESGDMAYILDTGNSDVRTEGMSYGMMICVQLGRQEEFDKLWKWAKTHMQYKPGDSREGLFAWQCETNGTIKGSSCAPDGEAYFLTALFFASHRWGNSGDINYETEAQYLIKEILDKPGRQAGSVSPIFNLSNYLITFGETSYGFTDPSYNLPGFFELWAKWTDTNKDFWKKTAEAARDLLYNSSNSSTGLFPDYSEFDGTPYKPSWVGYESDYYKYDAIRCAMNVGMDYNWFEADSRQTTMMNKLLNFFKNDGYKNGYFTVDGSAQGGNYSEGMAGANGVGVFALDDESLAKEYVTKLWNTTAPSGQWRYYNGMVYFLSMLHASGDFKIYKPIPEQVDSTITGKEEVIFNGEKYTNNTTFSTFYNCKIYNIKIVIEEGTSVSEVKNDGFSIYPNPAKDMIHIESTQEIKQINIFDLTGITLSKTKNTENIDVTNLENGTYIIQVTFADNNSYFSKFIIRK